MSDLHSIRGKVALVAGGAKNLGGLIAKDLAAQGAKAIAIHYNSAGTKADADATVAAIQACMLCLRSYEAADKGAEVEGRSGLSAVSADRLQ